MNSDENSRPGDGMQGPPEPEPGDPPLGDDLDTRVVPAPEDQPEIDPQGTQPMKTSRIDDFGGFSLEEKIGEGGMGIVYRAYDPDLQRLVAIKKIHPRYAGHEDYARRFLEEARAVAAVLHPNVAQIFSIHAREEGTPPFFVMEFVDGQSSEEWVRESGPWGSSEAST